MSSWGCRSVLFMSYCCPILVVLVPYSCPTGVVVVFGVVLVSSCIRVRIAMLAHRGGAEPAVRAADGADQGRLHGLSPHEGAMPPSLAQACALDSVCAGFGAVEAERAGFSLQRHIPAHSASALL